MAMNTRIITLLILPIVLLSLACSKRLERGVAENQLQTKYAAERQYEYIQTGMNPPYGEATHYVAVRSGSAKTGSLGALADAGFLSLKLSQRTSAIHGGGTRITW
jgi:hypothetical protein